MTRGNGTATNLPQTLQAVYDAANEMTTYNNPTPNLTYDANGNLTNDGTKTYTWNARNQLISISGNATASFSYDALGRRISKTINGTRIDYQYDGNDIIAEIGGGAVGGTYVRSLNIDEPFARTTNSGTEFYHTDALGSVFALTNTSGITTASYTYDPFGNTTQTGISSNSFQYTGRENDGTGLYYYRARYYSPSLQRFISEDPIGLKGGINFYAYVQDNPINYTDNLGLKKCPSCDAQLPDSPIKEVALTCFAEASSNCSEGEDEKRAITDVILNRVAANQPYWGGNTVLGVLSQRNQLLGFDSKRYHQGEDPKNLNQAECKQLKECIAAAQASFTGVKYSYNGFNQTKRPGRTRICVHYFRIDPY